MTEQPDARAALDAAREAYLRAHPHREDDVDAAFEAFDLDAEPDPVAVDTPAPPPPEQIAMDDGDG